MNDLEALFEVPGSVPPAPDSRSSGHLPLAARMRPRSIEELAGQEHLLGAGSPLRSLLESPVPSSMLLYGPPGTGKTTIARLLSSSTHRFAALSALGSGVKELRAVFDQAQRERDRTTILFVDEIHRFSRTQQDALLGAVEDRTVVLVAATTENPSFSVVSPLLSRLIVAQLRALDDAAISRVLTRAVDDPRGLRGEFELSGEALTAIVRLAGGDARRSLTTLEASAASAWGRGERSITVECVEQAAAQATVRYDRDGDQHHDTVSAFIKSIRGSDPDAALHYLARMLVAGEDPRFIARRLLVHATEDVGLADPSALHAAVNAAQTVQFLGMPEARLALAQVTVHLALAPKSNSVIQAIDQAMSDVRGGVGGDIPPHLRFSRYAGAADHRDARGYRYPHRDPEGVIAQQYPPDELVGTDYYRPTPRGLEADLGEELVRVRARTRGRGQPG